MNSRIIAAAAVVVLSGAVIMYHNTAPAQVPETPVATQVAQASEISHTAPVAVPDAPLVAQGVDGKEIYLKSCKECHGVLGAPTKASLRKYDKIPDFTSPEFFKTKKHEELIEAVEKGKGRDMKGFAEKLNKEEIKAVVVYVHTLEKKA